MNYLWLRLQKSTGIIYKNLPRLTAFVIELGKVSDMCFRLQSYLIAAFRCFINPFKVLFSKSDVGYPHFIAF